MQKTVKGLLKVIIRPHNIEYLMTFKENEELKAAIRKRLADLHTEDCRYCGGYHELILSRDGMSIYAANVCCDEMMRQAHKIIRDVRKEYGDPYFQD